jgi:hypothetical protein
LPRLRSGAAASSVRGLRRTHYSLVCSGGRHVHREGAGSPSDLRHRPRAADWSGTSSPYDRSGAGLNRLLPRRKSLALLERLPRNRLRESCRRQGPDVGPNLAPHTGRGSFARARSPGVRRRGGRLSSKPERHSLLRSLPRGTRCAPGHARRADRGAHLESEDGARPHSATQCPLILWQTESGL